MTQEYAGPHRINTDLDWNHPVRTQYDNGDVVYLVDCPGRAGIIHNHTGPAVLGGRDGRPEWYLWGRRYPFESWRELSDATEAQLTYLRLRYNIR